MRRSPMGDQAPNWNCLPTSSQWRDSRCRLANQLLEYKDYGRKSVIDLKSRLETSAQWDGAARSDAPFRSGNCLPARRQPSLSRGIVELASSRAEPREAEAVNAILPGQYLVGAERVAAAGLIQG